MAGSLLQARARGDVDLDDLQLDAQVIADALAMGRPRLRDRLQAMLDVNRAQRRCTMAAGVGGEPVQQNGGVQAAREGDVPGAGAKPGGGINHQGFHQPE